MADFSLVALKDEIVADPESLGYKNVDDGWAGGPEAVKGDQEIADLGNAKDFTLTRSQISTEELSMAVGKAAFLNLSPGESDWLRWITVSQSIVVTADLIDALYGDGSIFGGQGAQATKDALQAVIEVPASRFEVLWGEGISISARQAGDAFNEV